MRVADGPTAPVPTPRARRRTSSDLTTAVGQVLASWTATTVDGTAGPDLGPAVLAAVLDDPDTTSEVLPLWLRRGVRCGTVGLHGGMAGVLAGLRMIAEVRPGVGAAAERTATSLAGAATRLRWRSSGIGFDDYDLVSGPAGLLLAHTTGGLPVRQEHLTTLTTHLAALGADPELDGLRIGAHRDHPLVGWAQGGVVTGLAHGVAGVVAALSGLPLTDDHTVRALRNLCAWLVAQRSVDGLGITSWPRRGPTPGSRSVGVVRRQAWCYGNPGVSWALWSAGDTMARAGVGDGDSLRETATAAMRSLCGGFDPEVHLDVTDLNVCHGAAGIMLVADAFARHAALPEAAVLRDRLSTYLSDRMAEVVALGRADTSLLTGATGVLAALLTVRGARRGWLRCLALA